MLIAITGSQGSGKSRVLQEIKNHGYNVIERKTSRSILDDWNITIEDVSSDMNLAVKFQDEITSRKHSDEVAATVSPEVWFTERTHVDLFTYSLITLGNNNIYSDWLDEYFNTCLKYSQLYSAVYYLQGGKFVVEHDGVRGSNQHYSRMVDMLMVDFTKQMIHNSKLTILDMPDLQQRVNTILFQTDPSTFLI